MTHRIEKRLAAVFACLLVLLCSTAIHADTLVATQEEFRSAVKAAKPGDTIAMADGVWRDFEMVFSGEGTAKKPITLTAQTRGKVVISGVSNLRIAGEHLVVKGLVFRDGYTPTNEVISFRRSKDQLANHSRVTEVVIDHFNNPERFERDFWVMMYGRNNRFDHNHIEGKSNAGVTMAVRLDSKASQNNHHRIDHNYFGPRPELGSNGGETLRIGTSHYSLTDSFTTVENNYFDRCNGEVEIISSKSGNNVFRGNVFFESKGTLTLRHGNDNLIENNIFFGNGVDHTGGIRLINKRQTIRNNYLYGLKGYRFGGGLVVMNGVPNSPINRYHQVEDSVVENNTIIDTDHVEFAAGSDEERSAVPITTKFLNNLIVHRQPTDVITFHDDVSGITFDGNIVSGATSVPDTKGLSESRVKLVESANGLFYPADQQGVGVKPGLKALPRDATGVAWYPKPGYANHFDSGQVHTIKPGQDTLAKAVAEAKAGDVIELSGGDYISTRIINVTQPITLRGKAGQKGRPLLRFERTTLFEMKDGGSLKLEHLDIDGASAPDAYDNSAVRTSRYSMLSNYELIVSDVNVSNLNTNHSFNFLKVSKHTFASNIEISDSAFSDISGNVIGLEREIDDLGIYNGEYITIVNSRFENIGKALANIYRGGTDESTFGPHFQLSDSTLKNVGNDKRNKVDASIFLLGVQVATLKNNQVTSSRPIRVVETVGDPITRLSKNRFKETKQPVIGPISAVQR
ncbi:MAG: chondroitinase-B domain-containing protein [Lysobacterales bacterium]